MKNGKTALLCLVLSLFALFGCAQEASIPEGWVEYDLPETGVKIALPPHYVLAAKELTPTDADYERAGMHESLQEYFAMSMESAFDDPRISVCVMSSKNDQPAVGVFSMGNVPDEVDWLGSDTTTLSNIRRYSKLVFEIYKDDANYYGTDGIIANEQCCYAVVEREYTEDDGVEAYQRVYAALFEGKRIEIIWGGDKVLADDELIGEFDEIVRAIRVE